MKGFYRQSKPYQNPVIIERMRRIEWLNDYIDNKIPISAREVIARLQAQHGVRKATALEYLQVLYDDGIYHDKNGTIRRGKSKAK